MQTLLLGAALLLLFGGSKAAAASSSMPAANQAPVGVDNTGRDFRTGADVFSQIVSGIATVLSETGGRSTRAQTPNPVVQQDW